jgi:HEAT repeat protein
MADGNPQVRFAAIDALTSAGPAIVPEMIRLLKSGNVRVRASAATVLGNLRDDARAAVPQLRELVGDADSIVREAAAQALRKIGG